MVARKTPTQPAFEDLKTGRLFSIGRTLYQVSTPYAGYVTAEIVLPKPPRTTVVTISREYYRERAVTPSDSTIKRYDREWGFADAR